MNKQNISAALLALSLLAVGCATTGDPADDRSSAHPENELSGSATVFAAASLTEPFNEIAELFRAGNPSADISFNFGASSGLATQIIEQGGADLFASADQVNMKKVADEDLLQQAPRVFIRNRLEIVVAPGNPEGITGLSDLARTDVKVVLAAAQVPVGRYSREALAKAEVTVRPVSEAVDVKGVVGPVTLGEADAGIVYASDVKAAGDRAAGVPIPDNQNVLAEYPMGVIKSASNPQVARAFMDLVLSPQGREVLTDHGFIAP